MDGVLVASTQIGEIKNLTAIICKCDLDEQFDRSPVGDDQLILSKTKELISAFNQILCLPNTDEGLILVMLNKSTIDAKLIDDKMDYLNLEVVDSENVTLGLLQTCLEYTLKVRLAPLWNRNGGSFTTPTITFVRGQNFLTTNTPSDAVQLIIRSYDGIVQFEMKSHKLTLNHINLEDLNVSSIDLDHFYEDEEAVLPYDSFGIREFTVLPNLTRGKIVSAHRTIPENSPFYDYQQLRDYWMDTHGYLLPSVQEQYKIIYYQVHFNQIGHLTYPSLCLLNAPPLKVIGTTEVDKKSISDMFLQDVRLKMATILGSPIKWNYGI